LNNKSDFIRKTLFAGLRGAPCEISSVLTNTRSRVGDDIIVSRNVYDEFANISLSHMKITLGKLSTSFRIQC